jgi:hypothetical protein
MPEDLVKPPINVGTATSISKMPNTGLLDTVRNWIQGNAPDSVLDIGKNLLTLGSILGLDSPASAFGGGVPASAGAIIPKIESLAPQVESKAQPFASGLKKLAQSMVRAEPTGNAVQDSWLLSHPSGGTIEVTFGDNGVRIDQVRSGEKQGQGIGSALYEKLGQMMKQRGIPGNAITGDIQGNPVVINKLRAKASEIAGEGATETGRYEIPSIDIPESQKISAKVSASDKLRAKYKAVNVENIDHGFMSDTGTMHETPGEHYNVANKLFKSPIYGGLRTYNGVADYRVWQPNTPNAPKTLWVNFVGKPTPSQVKSVKEFLALDPTNQVKWEVSNYPPISMSNNWRGESLSELIHAVGQKDTGLTALQAEKIRNKVSQ